MAFTQNTPLGVDLELVKDDLEFDSIACHFFAQGEIEVLDAVSPDQRALSFFNCWTRKEAVIKARGDGLTFPLNQFEVSHRPEDPVVILGFLGKNEESEQWSLTSLDVDEGCVGALALKSEDILFNIIIGSSKKNRFGYQTISEPTGSNRYFFIGPNR